MDTLHSDLEAIRQILADLTTRVYRIERRLQMEAPAVERHPPSVAETPGTLQTSQVPPAAGFNPQVPTAAPGPNIPPEPSARRIEADSAAPREPSF